MNHKEFSRIYKDQVAQCTDTLVNKAKEYATEDRLHNFKVAGGLQGITAKEALAGMMAKHIVSIYDLVQKDEPTAAAVWDEKIGDALNYLFLLKAVVIEEGLYD